MGAVIAMAMTAPIGVLINVSIAVCMGVALNLSR
jgi:hypothetical protein